MKRQARTNFTTVVSVVGDMLAKSHLGFRRNNTTDKQVSWVLKNPSGDKITVDVEPEGPAFLVKYQGDDRWAKKSPTLNGIMALAKDAIKSAEAFLWGLDEGLAARVAKRYLEGTSKTALKQRQFLKLMDVGGSFGIISAYGSAESGMGKSESKGNVGELVGALQKLGYRKWHTLKAAPWAEGEYREMSYLIPGIRPEHLFALCVQFEQNAVIYKSADGVLGMYNPVRHFANVAVDPQGDPIFEVANDQHLYSKDRNWSFEFGFAFAEELPWDGKHPFSRKQLRKLRAA